MASNNCVSQISIESHSRSQGDSWVGVSFVLGCCWVLLRTLANRPMQKLVNAAMAAVAVTRSLLISWTYIKYAGCRDPGYPMGRRMPHQTER